MHPDSLRSNKLKLFRLLVIVLGFQSWHCTLVAEETQQSVQYAITPYLWIASINGTAAIGNDESPPIDSDYNFFSLDNLDGVASATFSARGRQWGSLFDFLYVAYDDTLLEGSILQVKPRLDGRILEFTGTYKPMSVSNIDIIAGIRQQDIDFELTFSNRSPQVSITWYDPFVGIIYSPRLANNWHLSLRGDLGGFGVESELATNIEAKLRYQPGKTFSFDFGYRYLKVDFEDNNLLYDLSLDGFLLGLGINF
jgi:hypothetical protein